VPIKIRPGSARPAVGGEQPMPWWSGLALTISTTVLAYFFIFPALVILRCKYLDAERPYRVPGGQVGAWLAVVITKAQISGSRSA